MPKIVIFNHDNSSRPHFNVRTCLERFDVVDVVPDGVPLGSDIVSPVFLVVETDTPIEDLLYLKEPHVNIAAAEYETLHPRLYSMAGLFAASGAREHYKNTLVATGKVTIPQADVLDLLSLYQRVKT